MSVTRGEFREILRRVEAGESAERVLFTREGGCVRRFAPRERLVLLGCGYIAQALCGYGADLGFAVTAVDDRPDFASRTLFPRAERVVCDGFAPAIAALSLTERDYVAVLTRGHRYDAECLRGILPGPFPRYLGMIGSGRRVAGLKRQLGEEGFAPELLARLHAPIGLDINALTVPEIAVAIAAELVQCRRAGLNRHGRGAFLTDEGVSLDLLRYLAEDEEPKCVVTVYDTAGSTPVKSGAMMAVSALGTVGTVGGGCGEARLMQEARRILGTGQSRETELELRQEEAEEAGMVCGGVMRVLLEDLTL